MTNTHTATANAAHATDCADSVNASKPSKKRLRGSSEAHKKRATSSSLSASNRKALHTASANGSAASNAGDMVSEHPRETKASVFEALLTREGGASLEALCEATCWQTHTCRAFLTGLRKRGKEVIRASDKDGKSIYLIAPDRSPAPPSEAEQVEAESR